jgi:hypothetical protein
VEGDNSVEDKRRWPRRITLALVVVPIVLALPKFLLAIAHARADSEVGVMMYGFPLFLGLFYGSPVVAVFVVLWGLGLTKARRQGETIPGLELWVFRGIAAALLLLLLLLSEGYVRMARHVLGL